MEEIAGLEAAERALVARYWWQRAAGELTSWVGWQHVLEDLRAEASPDAVIALAERAVKDEYQHSIWCRDWAERFGHGCGELKPRGDRRFALPNANDAENRVLRIALCCFTETVGCFTLQHARPFIQAAPLRKLNRRHLADELQHSRACWAHLSVLEARKRERLRGFVPDLLSLLARISCRGDTNEREDLIQFGYFTPTLLRAAHEDAVRSVIAPGLAHLGLAEVA